MKFAKSLSEINFKETCTYILPKGVVLDVVYHGISRSEKGDRVGKDLFGITVGNANLDEGKWFGNSYDTIDWFNKISTTDGKTILEVWINNSINDSNYYK